MPAFEQLIGTQIGLILTFLITAGIVVVTGTRLSVYGDALGDRTGLGSGLVGLIFLAAVTSLPELVVSLTSVLQNSNINAGVDLATGNMLGSNIFNLLIIAGVALLFPKKFDPTKLKQSHTDSLLYGLLLLLLFSVAFWVAKQIQLPFYIRNGITITLPLAYGFMLIHEHRKQSPNQEEPHTPEEDKLTHTPALRFYSILMGLCGLIIAGGIILSLLGSQMALPKEQGGFGLEASLIGSLFLAISTSLPELVISISSVRLGFLDMAIGNVLGSNMFNLLIIFVTDAALRKETLLEHASPKHWASVFLIFILTLLAGWLLHTKKKASTLAIAIVMIILYIFGFIWIN